MGKGSLAELQRSIQDLNRQVQRLQPRQARPAPAEQANWDCAFCALGVNNFADRTYCYKCARDRVTGVAHTAGVVKQQAGARQAHSRPRSKPAKPVASPPAPPKTQDADPPSAQEEDPVWVELAAARSYLEWVRKQKPAVKDKELPAAQKRLTEAEARDKERKPPGERLQSALSRVDHRQKQADQAKEAADSAEAAFKKAREEADAAAAQLKEAQQELQVAQSIHRTWGPSADAHDPPYSPAGALSGVSGLNAQHVEVLRQISEGFAPGTPHSDLLRELLAGAAPPPEAGTAPPPEGVSGAGDKDAHSGAQRALTKSPTPKQPRLGPYSGGKKATVKAPSRSQSPEGAGSATKAEGAGTAEADAMKD